jgi:hypothetical protein
MERSKSFIPDAPCHHCRQPFETPGSFRYLAYKGERHVYHQWCFETLCKQFGNILMRSMPHEQVNRIVSTFTTTS